MTLKKDKILVVDFGSQYTQLIARRVRELGVYSEVVPWDLPIDSIRNNKPRGIILSGGPESAHQSDSPRVCKSIFDLNIPILGICYGMQVMAEQLGGLVTSSSKKEFGKAVVEITGASPIFKNVNNNEKFIEVWMSHGDRVEKPPIGFNVIAKSENAPLAAVSNHKKNFYAIQFHPEVTHTKDGKTILNNFVNDICQCKKEWSTTKIIETAVSKIKKEVGSDKIILGLSGGVDSSVTAVLLQRAIGTQLTCVFVDNGLLRANEAQEVMELFSKNLGVHVVKVNAQNIFFSNLKGIVDPEEKRKVIGKTFIDIFDKEAQKIQNVNWLAQGTIYPDVIESAGNTNSTAKKIKSHHNVGGLPHDMRMKLVEPLRNLFKDEVRSIGAELGLPQMLLNRHPFPGPGLAVRILGEVKEEYADLLRAVDLIFIEELYLNKLYDDVSQAFAVFLPVKSVGVVGDNRSYDYVVALRAVQTIDFMTADWARLSYEFLHNVSNRILNEVNGVARVTYDISSKPPATIEWE